MIWKLRFSQIFLFFSVLIISPIVYGEDDLYYGDFNGSWEGTLYLIGLDLPGFPYTLSTKEIDKNGGESKIVVSGQNVEVYYKWKGKWKEVKPGQFKINKHKTNAIIFAINSSSDVYDKTGSGGWVETWNFTLTYKDKNSVYVYVTRAVNNYMKKYDEEISRFFISSFGDFQKVS